MGQFSWGVIPFIFWLVIGVYLCFHAEIRTLKRFLVASACIVIFPWGTYNLLWSLTRSEPLSFWLPVCAALLGLRICLKWAEFEKEATAKENTTYVWKILGRDWKTLKEGVLDQSAVVGVLAIGCGFLITVYEVLAGLRDFLRVPIGIKGVRSFTEELLNPEPLELTSLGLIIGGWLLLRWTIKHK